MPRPQLAGFDLSTEAPPSHDDDDYDDNDEDDEPEPQKSGVDMFLGAVAPHVQDLLAAWQVNGKKGEGEPPKTHSMAHFARIRVALNSKEREYLDVLLADEQAGGAIADELQRQSVEHAVAWLRQGMIGGSVSPPKPKSVASVMNDPRVLQKVKSVSALMEADERARLMRLAPRMLKSPDAIEIVEKILPLSDDDAAEWVRANLGEIEKRFAS